MSISYLRLAVAGAAVGGGLVFGAGPAGAQACYPPGPDCVESPEPTVVLSARVVAPGQEINVTVSGCEPNTTGTVFISSVDQPIGQFTTNSTGTGSTSVQIPTGISPGRYTIIARCTAPDGSQVESSQQITVVAPAAAGGVARNPTGSGGIVRGQLARTGAVIVPTALVGLGLVGGGIALQRSSRRSKASQSPA